MNTKLAIVGGAESTSHLAPYDDLTWDIWSVARRWYEPYLKRVTKFFEIHHRNSFEGFYVDELKALTVPIFMQEKHADIPMSDEFKVIYFVKKEDWFVNTFCYLVPYAVKEGYKEIVFYGIDIENNWEYQWDCLCYHAKHARAAGTSVTFFGINKEETNTSYSLATVRAPKHYAYTYCRGGDFNTHVLKEKDRKDILPEEGI